VLGLPSASDHGATPPVAVRKSFLPALLARSSFRNERKFAVSFGDTVLQPMPCEPGYSQLRRR
jgi:hypothetical protein